jgi:hypothetical protein
MRNVMVALVLLFTSYASAENLPPSFLVLRQNAKLIIVAAQAQQSFELTDSEPIFSWEGRSSKATFATDAEGVTIEFKLDIIGPDWLYVTLADSEDGLVLTICRTDSSGTDSHSIDSRWYSDYSGVLADRDYSAMISALFRRYRQNPLLPEIECLRTTVFNLDPPIDANLDNQCVKLIGLLGDSNWRVRNAATQQLTKPGYVEHALVVSRKMSLTREQRSRIDAIAARYQLDIQEALVAPLASVVLPQTDLALASE